MAFKPVALLFAVALGLAACGDTVSEQAVLGGVVGAGAGAVAGGSLLTAAAVGAGANVLYCQVGNNVC